MDRRPMWIGVVSSTPARNNVCTVRFVPVLDAVASVETRVNKKHGRQLKGSRSANLLFGNELHGRYPRGDERWLIP